MRAEATVTLDVSCSVDGPPQRDPNGPDSQGGHRVLINRVNLHLALGGSFEEDAEKRVVEEVAEE